MAAPPSAGVSPGQPVPSSTGAESEATHTPSWAVLKMRSLIDSPIPVESPLLLQAMTDVQRIYQEHGTRSTDDIKHKLIEQTVDKSRQVVDTFNETSTQLSQINTNIHNMKLNINNLSNKLVGARTGALTVISETSQLRIKLKESEYRAVVSNIFLNKFILQGELAKALEQHQAQDGGVHDNNSNNNDINPNFIKALHKLESIYNDSRLLLRLKNQRAGLESLEFAATKREEAYEKIFRYIQSQASVINIDDVEEKEDEALLLRQSIRCLRVRPMLLKLCSEEISSSRRALLVNKFVDALTKGGPNGMPPPIELHAHDAMRYTNDMLAWIHQSLASEKELITKLFTYDNTESNHTDSVPLNDSQEISREHNQQLTLRVLNNIFDALCRPFRIRFEQALEQSLPVVTLYRLASLLEFYSTTISQLLGSDSALPEMLMECHSLAMYAFFTAWKNKMESFKLSGIGPSSDLIPPVAVYQSMTRLDEIMQTLDASLSPASSRHAQIQAILEVIINPLQSLCEKICKHLSVIEKHIFLANCIDCMCNPLMPYPFASKRVESLTQVADSHMDEYIRLSCIIVLRRCGLAERARILSDYKDKQQGRVALSKVAGMDVEALSISVKNFYAMLFGGSSIGSSEALQPPQVEKITNVRARNRARVAVATSIAKIHSAIFEAVTDRDNQYGPDAVAIIGLRDAQKVEVILTNGHTG